MDPHTPLPSPVPESTAPPPEESDIVARANVKRPPVFDPTGRVESINDNEIKIADIRRHPFGLFVIYLQVIVALGLSFGLIFVLLPGVLDSLGGSGGGVSAIAAGLALFVAILAMAFLLLATRIYNASQLIVTNMHVTQVAQIGLFNRRVSELAMNNIEDVVAQQKGIFPTIFNYGTLDVETAGAEENFHFIYCPNPNAYAKAILDARAVFLERHGE